MFQESHQWLPESLEERRKHESRHPNHDDGKKSSRKSKSKKKSTRNNHEAHVRNGGSSDNNNKERKSYQSHAAGHNLGTSEKKNESRSGSKRTSTHADDDSNDLVLKHRLHKPDNAKSTRRISKEKPPRTRSNQTDSTISIRSVDSRADEQNVEKHRVLPDNAKSTRKMGKEKAKRTISNQTERTMSANSIASSADEIVKNERFKMYNGHDVERSSSRKIVIDVHGSSNNRDNSNDCFGSCLSNRRIIVMIIIYAVIATGLWTFFFNWSWSLPGKQNQIDDLKEQVDILDKETKELEGQVGRLEEQVSSLSKETDRLELINEDMKSTANDLNATVVRYQAINQNTTESIEIYQELNAELTKSLSEAEAINDILSDSITILDTEVKSLQNLKLNLTSTIDILESQNSNFTTFIDSLHRTNNQSRLQIERLVDELTELEAQNNELDKNNENLVSILTFMTQTGIDLNTTIDDLTGYLGQEITENTVLVLLSLEHSYQNIYKYWTATGLFDDLFGKKVWFENRNANEPIGSSSEYETLMEFIDEYIITEVCANRQDFENFLVNDPVVGYDGEDVPPVNISFRSIRSAIERYFSSLMKHYFSFDDNEGVSKIQWMEAMFDCKNLPAELRYKWS